MNFGPKAMHMLLGLMSGQQNRGQALQQAAMEDWTRRMTMGKQQHSEGMDVRGADLADNRFVLEETMAGHNVDMDRLAHELARDKHVSSDEIGRGHLEVGRGQLGARQQMDAHNRAMNIHDVTQKTSDRAYDRGWAQQGRAYAQEQDVRAHEHKDADRELRREIAEIQAASRGSGGFTSSAEAYQTYVNKLVTEVQEGLQPSRNLEALLETTKQLYEEVHGPGSAPVTHWPTDTP